MYTVVAVVLSGFVLLAVIGEPQDSMGGPLFGLPAPSGPGVPAGSGVRASMAHHVDRASASGRPRHPGPTASPAPRWPSRPQYYVPGAAVALSFDDGPDPRWTPQILALLRANHVHATFCMIGRQARAHPELVRQVVAGGNALCDHTWDHDEHLPAAPPAHVAWEIGSADDAIQVASGGVRPRYFRAPGGNWSPVEFAAAGARGMHPLAWSVDPRDWARPGTAHILQAVLAARAGDIVLCHDGGGDRAQTVQALRYALPVLRQRGFEFVLP